MDPKTLEKIGAPIVKLIWDNVIHPELQKLEASIGQPAIAALLVALDPILNKAIDDELDSLTKQ